MALTVGELANRSSLQVLAVNRILVPVKINGNVERGGEIKEG